MKTVLWIYSKPLFPEAGGTERITSLVMRGLTNCGHRCLGILVVVPKENRITYEGESINDLYAFLKQQSVDVVINQWGQLPDFLHYFLDNGGEAWQNEGGKIISCLHFDTKPIVLSYEIGLTKHKSLRDYYAILKTKLLEHYIENKRKQVIGEAYKYVYDHSDYYVLLSKHFQKYFEEAIGETSLPKLRCINNPLTFDGISAPDTLKEKKNIILVVSRMYERQKRISLVLKVWEKVSSLPALTNWELKIVGDGDDLDDYKQYALEHHLSRISFEGQQSPEKYYEGAQIFLMTSIMEGWGLTLTESLQKGVVPVAFDTCGAFYDIIEDGVNGFIVSEGNMNEYCKKVLLLVSDKNRWEDMAEAALKSAEKFTIEKTALKWREIIE